MLCVHRLKTHDERTLSIVPQNDFSVTNLVYLFHHWKLLVRQIGCLFFLVGLGGFGPPSLAPEAKSLDQASRQPREAMSDSWQADLCVILSSASVFLGFLMV